jgi:hypothetical protein
MSIAKTLIIALTAASVFSSAALADTSLSSDSAAGSGAAKTDTSATVTTGSIVNEPTFDQRMQDCMAIWDKGTHMTKQQWRRSCKTTLQSLAN